MADAAALETIRFFRQSPAIDDKSKQPNPAGAQKSYDPVTIADRNAEQAIRKVAANRFPEHGVFGEEFGIHNPDATMRWVVDPIDGTAAYVLGWPMWGTLIGLTEKGSPVLGLMDQPFTHERFWSTADVAMMRRHNEHEMQLKTRACSSLSQASLTTTHPDYFADPEKAAAFQRVKSAVQTTRYGGDCYAYAMLAAGTVDLVVECDLNAYDIAALIPIVEKSGGVITTWTGRPATEGGDIVAAGDHRIHAAALETLNAS